MASTSTAGSVITCKAAVAWAPKQPLVIEDIQVQPPQAGQVRIQIVATSLCHTDVSFLQAEQGIFPVIVGHEAAGIVESVGEGVKDLKEGDHVIPTYVPECGDCSLCKSDKTNMCEKFLERLKRLTFHDHDKPIFSKHGRPIHPFMTSTFSEYTVLPHECVAKIRPEAPLDKVCLLACGIPTGVGAVWNIAKVEAGSSVAVFGLGTVGLAVADGARIAGAARIIGVDINPKKSSIAKGFGVTDFVNPKEHDKPIQQVLWELMNGGVDYCFECVGNSNLMHAAFASSREGVGRVILVGMENPVKQLCFSVADFFSGRVILGCLFGGFKGRSQLPHLVDKALKKDVKMEEYITHELPFAKINDAIALLLQGTCLRCVMHM